MKGTVEVLDIPTDAELKAYTSQVIANNFDFEKTSSERFAERKNNPIPLYPGEKESPIKHIVTDYVEKNVRGWFRSYPHVQEDALVYAPTGFIWNNAIKHGKSVWIYGEACVPEFDNNLTWENIYTAFKNGEKTAFKNTTTIHTVWDILSQNYPGYGSHKFSDVLRAQAFIEEMKEYESQKGDQWPELIIIALPNDHTAGTRPGFPTPRAMVADNDLALGQILEMKYPSTK